MTYTLGKVPPIDWTIAKARARAGAKAGAGVAAKLGAWTLVVGVTAVILIGFVSFFVTSF